MSSQYFGVGYTYTFDFEKDGDFEFGYTYTNGSYTNSYSSSGEWEWENNKEEIEIEINGYVIDFEIIKLTKQELILEDKSGQVFSGGEIVIHFRAEGIDSERRSNTKQTTHVVTKVFARSLNSSLL